MSWRAFSLSVPALKDRPGLALAGAFLALAPVAVFASNGTVVVVAVTGLALALSRPQFRAALQSVAAPLSLALIAFLLWAALSAVWAPHPLRSATLALRCTALFAAGLICVSAAAGMRPMERRVAVLGLALGGLAMTLLLAFETVSDDALARFLRGMDMATLMAHTNNVPLARGGTVLALFCWPTLLAVARLRGVRAAALLFLPILVLLWFQPITASAVAVSLGAVAFLLVRFWPRPALALIFVLFLASLVVAPAVPPLLAGTAPVEAETPYLPLSWQHRIEIWRFAAERSLERPLIGWGFDAARVLGRAVESEVLPGHHLALHPHNFSLQVWLELGAVGVAITVAFGLLLLRRLWRFADDRVATATAAAALTAYLVYGQISRGAWQNWWLAAAWLLAAALAAVLPFRAPGAEAARAEPRPG